MYLIGVDIGGTKCAAVLGKEGEGFSGDLILDKVAFPTLPGRGAGAVIEEITHSIDRLLSGNGLSSVDLAGIGVSCGGPLDSRAGVIMSPPNLPGFDNIPIVDILKKRYNIRACLQNDANACAVAEWRFGAARSCDNVVFLTFGTGMGAGLILGGRLYSGANDMAGEVGHIRLADTGPVGYGKAGSFEGFCSGGGVALMAREMARVAVSSGVKSPLFEDIENISAKSLFDAAGEEDAFAVSVVRRCGEKLGLALSILIDILNPEVIVIGSIYQRNRELFDEIIAPVLESEALPLSRSVCKIVPSALGDSIGDYAALALAAQLSQESGFRS